jgi:hypothetical protein
VNEQRILAVPASLQRFQHRLVGLLGDVLEVERQIHVEGADVGFGGIGEQERRDPAPDDHEVIAELPHAMDQLDEDGAARRDRLGAVIVDGHHCGRSLWSSRNAAASSPRPRSRTRSR